MSADHQPKIEPESVSQDDVPPKPQRTLQSVLGTAGMLLVTMLATYIAFMATCFTVGIATVGPAGGMGIALSMILGLTAGGLTLMAIVNSYWKPKKQ